MHPEPHFSRRGGDLYRTHWARGVFVVEEWVEGAWHAVPAPDYVTYNAVAISRDAAVEMMGRSDGRRP